MHRFRHLLLALVLLVSISTALLAQPAIGHWRDHFPFRKTLAVAEGGGRIYCATTTGVFSYDPGNGEVQRMTKVNALSDVDVRCLGWNSSIGALLVGYGNGNLDIISAGGAARNLGDIKRSNLIGDKGIYAIRSEGTMAYLSCGFGIVQIDLARMEVRDTWLIGPNGSQVLVYGLTFFQDSIHAATSAGVFSALRTAPNLASFTSWHRRTDVPHPTGAFTAIAGFGDRLLVNYRVDPGVENETDTVFYWSSGIWQRMTPLYGMYNRSFKVSDDEQRLVVTHKFSVRMFDQSLNEVAFAQNIGSAPLLPVQAIARVANSFWVATQEHGLVRFSNPDDFNVIVPNGPANSSAYRMSSAEGVLYVATGAVSGNWGNAFRKDGVHHFVDNSWGTLDRSNDPLFDAGGNTFAGTVNDIMAVAVDPADGTHVFAGSWDDGLLELRDQHVTGFYNGNTANSSLQGFQNSSDPGSPTQVGGLAYDKSGNLWMTNSNCTSPISVRTKSGGWRSFSPGSILNNNTLLSDIVAAENGYKWIIRPRSNGLLVFSDNGTISDNGDDRYKVLNTFEGQGKLPSMDVYSVAEDLDGQVWVGTGKGITVFYSPDAIFSGGNFDAQQIIIEQEGRGRYLLETEAVSAIAVDGANRKWLGTQNSGVYLVSADGTEELAHFTKENSPLPSNTITCIAIEGATGEVFFGTDQGILSYRGQATEGGSTADCAAVFPNPVRESYTGPVAISGLVRDSDVRITDVAGNLVYRTTSLGGQAIWPATDFSGQRVSTGVYLIFASDPTGEFNCNTKVLVVR